MINDKRNRGLLYQQPLPAGYIEEPQPSAPIAAGPLPLGPPVYPYGWGSGYNGSSTTGVPPMYGKVPADQWAVNNASPPNLKEPVTTQPAAVATPSASNPPASVSKPMVTTTDAMAGNQGMSYVPQGNVGTAEIPRGLNMGGGGASSGGMNELAARDMANQISRSNAPEYKQSAQITGLVDDIKSAAFFGQKKKGRILNALLESLVRAEAEKYGGQTRNYQTQLGAMGHAGQYLAGLGQAGITTAPEWGKIGLTEQQLPSAIKLQEAQTTKAYGEAGESEAKAGLMRREWKPTTEKEAINLAEAGATRGAKEDSLKSFSALLHSTFPNGPTKEEYNSLAQSVGINPLEATQYEQDTAEAKRRGILK